jgi:hypothetical protein
VTRVEDAWSRPIANEALTAELLPEPHAPFGEIAAFAGTHDGYAVMGIEELPRWSDALRARFEAELELPRGLDLTDLRTAVFAEERRAKWADAYLDPDADLSYLHALVEAIRAAVTGEPAPPVEAWSGLPPNRLQFSLGGVAGSSYAVELDHVESSDEHTELELGVLRFVHRRSAGRPHVEAVVRPDADEWGAFWHRLQQLGVLGWEGEFRTPRVVDGTSWSLELDWAGHTVSTSGSNAYPPHGDSTEPGHHFAAFCRAISRLCGHEVA